MEVALPVPSHHRPVMEPPYPWDYFESPRTGLAETARTAPTAGRGRTDY